MMHTWSQEISNLLEPQGKGNKTNEKNTCGCDKPEGNEGNSVQNQVVDHDEFSFEQEERVG